MKPRKQDEKILSDQYSYFEPIISDSCDIKFDENKRRMGSIFISHEEICFIKERRRLYIQNLIIRGDRL